MVLTLNSSKLALIVVIATALGVVSVTWTITKSLFQKIQLVVHGVVVTNPAYVKNKNRKVTPAAEYTMS